MKHANPTTILPICLLSLLCSAGCILLPPKQLGEITSSPPGASLYLHDTTSRHKIFIGSTPTNIWVRPGPYTLFLAAELTGYEQKEWVLPKSGDFSHHFELPKRWGALDIYTSSPGQTSQLSPPEKVASPPSYGPGTSIDVTNGAATYTIALHSDGDISLTVRTERKPTEQEVEDELAMAIRLKRDLGVTMRPRRYYTDRDIHIKRQFIQRAQKALQKFQEWSVTAATEHIASASKVIDEMKEPRDMLWGTLKLEFNRDDNRSRLTISTGSYSTPTYFDSQEAAPFVKLLDEIPRLEEESRARQKALDESEANKKAEKERIDKLLR